MTTISNPVRASVFTLGAALAMVGLSGHGAEAVSLQTQVQQGQYQTNMYGGSAWTTFTAMIDAQHTVTETADFSAIGAADALLVDQEYQNGPLSAAEIAAITGFVSGGKKAVIFGENSGWPDWNASVMALVGGAHTGACSWDVGTPLVANALTAGIGTVQNACGSLIDSLAGAPEMLFTNQMAAVFDVGAGEVLVILDSNWNDDTYILNENNRVFAQNVVDWLGTPIQAPTVPLPASLPILLTGFAGLGLLRMRRKA